MIFSFALGSRGLEFGVLESKVKGLEFRISGSGFQSRAFTVSVGPSLNVGCHMARTTS